jgi:transposase
MSTEASSSLPSDVALCHALILEQSAALEELQRRNEQLEHQLDQLLRRLYGPRSERVDPNQLTLFDRGALAEPTPAEPVAETVQTISAAARNGHGRRQLPKNLPRRRIEHTLPADQLPCPGCGQPREKFGEETSEQLEYEPASLYVVEHVRFKYACKCCQEQVATAEKPPQPIDKGLPGPGLLAYTAVSKFGDHLPLYRLEEIFTRHGLEIPRSTTCGWMRSCAELLRPLHERMVGEVLQSRVIHTDDTPVPVLDPTLPHTRTGRFWVYCGDEAHPYSVYDYTPSRRRDGPAEFLTNFTGYLQADAFGGYDGIFAGSQGQILEVACWAHARRKFHEAQRSAGRIAHEAMARIGQLYALERELKESCRGAWAELSRDQQQARIAAARRERAVPLLASFRGWLDTQAAHALPKSPVGQAIGYALSNWEALARYPEQGYLAIDNNLSERTLRPAAIGRKNWLFVGGDQGGRTAAAWFTMIASAKACGVDPLAWLRDVLTELPKFPASGPSVPDVTDLLPDRWLLAHPAARFHPNRRT